MKWKKTEKKLINRSNVIGILFILIIGCFYDAKDIDYAPNILKIEDSSENRKLNRLLNRIFLVHLIKSIKQNNIIFFYLNLF